MIVENILFKQTTANEYPATKRIHSKEFEKLMGTKKITWD